MIHVTSEGLENRNLLQFFITALGEKPKIRVIVTYLCTGQDLKGGGKPFQEKLRGGGVSFGKA